MKTVRFLFAFGALAFAGCSSPSFEAVIPRDGKSPIVVKQFGDAAKPAKVKVNAKETEKPSFVQKFAATCRAYYTARDERAALAKKPVEIAPKVETEGEGKGMGENEAENAVYSSTGTTVEIEGPTAFDPPAPPSPSEKAMGWNVTGAGLASVALVVFAGFLTYGGHLKAAAVSGTTAVAVAALAVFLSNETAQIVAMVGAGISLVIVACWYFVRNRIPPENGGTAKGMDG